MKNKILTENQIPSVNFHLWEPCNMSCKFCFASFQDVKKTILPKGHLPENEAIAVVKQLADLGFEKITFAGGEPSLCPCLSELIRLAKDLGMTTMLVTNGSRLTNSFLESNRRYLDWIAISIDSLNRETNSSIGRALSGKHALSADFYDVIIRKIKAYGYGLKINTVVNKYNYLENMLHFIQKANPKRWKVLQALPIKGQNDNQIDDIKVSSEEFQHFINTHKQVECMIPEDNNAMIGSYAMVDPAGRFFENSKGEHKYSKPIIEVGARSAIEEMDYSLSKFIQRGGVYDWESKTKKQNEPERITLSGGVASGKSTVGKMLAERLDYSFKSIGQKTRQIAEQRGLTILEYQQECLNNPELDKEIDREFSNECNTSSDLIIDYRLAFKFINSSFNVFLRVSDDTALGRLKKANRKNETYHTLHERNNCFVQQFKNTYNIDFTKEDQYDLVLDVDDMAPDEIVDRILIEM